MVIHLSELLTEERLQEVDKWCAKYPEQERQSAVMQSLMIVQQQHGYLTQERMDSVADYLNMPAIAVYEVATFYSMYEHEPCGQYKLEVCTNISCKLRGSAEVVKHLEESLDISVGQTTDDGQFTLRKVECLGACVNAPMMQVGNKYHERLTAEKLDEIITQYKNKDNT